MCSARKGVDARLERMLEARQEMRRRTEGCVRAWVSRSMDGQPMFLLQAIYDDEDCWILGMAASNHYLEVHL